MIDQFFLWCVWVLEVIGEVTGMGYELANIVIFVILQPGLILLFFILWRFEKKRKVKESKSEALLSFDEYQELFPDKDLKDSFKKLLDMNGKAKHDDAMKWFEREKKLKKMTFQKTKSGLFKAWCSKCNAKSFPNDEWQLKRGSECHGVEYVNEPIK